MCKIRSWKRWLRGCVIWLWAICPCAAHRLSTVPQVWLWYQQLCKKAVILGSLWNVSMHCGNDLNITTSKWTFLPYRSSTHMYLKIIVSEWSPRATHWPQWPMHFFPHKQSPVDPHCSNLNGKLSCTPIQKCCFVLIFWLRLGSQLPRSN